MMSFMRDQGAGNPSEHSSATEPQSVPSAGGPEAQEFLTVAASSKNVRRSTITVAILVAIGMVCLLFMIRKSQPQAAAAKQAANDETKIEAAISRITGVRSEMADRMEAILQKFYEFSDVFQVKVHELVKNPFEVEGGAMKGLKGQTVVSEDPQVQAELIRRQQMQEKAGTLRLLSIMRSDLGNSCMINDQILQQGQTIEGFTVVQIGGSSVELVWSPEGASGESVAQAEDMRITLKLSE
jgi:preprotein translocase subunit SecG